MNLAAGRARILRAIVPAVTTAHERFDHLDALRGCAMLWMAAFPFAFNLNFLGLLEPRQNFYDDPTWTTQRTAIVALFLFTAGAPGRRWRWPPGSGCWHGGTHCWPTRCRQR